MRKHITGGLLAALLAVSVTAGGCGSRESGDMVVEETAAAAAYNYDSMEMAEEAAMDMAPRAEMKMAAAGAAVADGVSEGGLPASQVMPEEISADRKLIRNVSLGYQTDQFERFTAMLQEETAKLGGYIESSDMSKDAYSSIRHAYFELRIPKEKLDSFLAGLDGEANLLHRSEYTQDVTLEYHDVESRKKALETEYDTLLRLLEQADSMDAILALNQRLSEIRYQLDSYESNLRMYDNQEVKKVTLVCSNEVMKGVIDKFGDEITVNKIDSEHFLTRVKVCTSPTFYGWVFQWGGKIRIEAPEEAVEEYREMARKAFKG